MIDLTAGVTTPQGFLASGVAAGLKSSKKKDIALVVSQGPEYTCAAVFTSNRFQAAPVQWSKQVTANGVLKGVILNSGGANACTGDQGSQDCATTAQKAAELIGCTPEDIAVCSTGLIGVLLDMDKVVPGIALATQMLSPDGGTSAAEAIMSTDTVTKQAAYTSSQGWSVAGMAKGAGMLAPALATMLVVITTDAQVTHSQASAFLAQATHLSFDRADSDGCMSTNDSVILMANGASGIEPDHTEFQEALTAVCVSLAKQLIDDAEGAQHAITITVRQSATQDDALEVARSIARSNLFKCAIAGNDPNWGRVLAAMGTTQAAYDPTKVDVLFNGVGVFLAGALGAPRDQVDLTGFEVNVEVALHEGDQEATLWTNDLTHGYVSENADYPT